MCPAVWRRLWRSRFWESMVWVTGVLGSKGTGEEEEKVPRWRLWEVRGEVRTVWTWNIASGCGGMVCMVPLSLGWPPPVYFED